METAPLLLHRSELLLKKTFFLLQGPKMDFQRKRKPSCTSEGPSLFPSIEMFCAQKLLLLLRQLSLDFFLAFLCEQPPKERGADFLKQFFQTKRMHAGTRATVPQMRTLLLKLLFIGTAPLERKMEGSHESKDLCFCGSKETYTGGRCGTAEMQSSRIGSNDTIHPLH